MKLLTFLGSLHLKTAILTEDKKGH